MRVATTICDSATYFSSTLIEKEKGLNRNEKNFGSFKHDVVCRSFRIRAAKSRYHRLAGISNSQERHGQAIRGWKETKSGMAQRAERLPALNGLGNNRRRSHRNLYR